MPRTVQSRWWRRDLEREAGGRCYLCGEQLGDDWETDHVKPWAVGGTTTPSNLRAACRRCNRRKGSMRFRAFQQWLHDRMGEVHALKLAPPEDIILDVGCGGGKSVAVVILAYWLIEVLRVVDRILWVVPNGTLRRQAARAFGPEDVAAKLLGHRLEIVEAGNTGNPAKGTSGYALTYAAAAAARLRGDGPVNPHVEELSARRYAVIVDEPHHLADTGDQQERGYMRGMMPLLTLAKVRVFMSGTLYRHDRKRIGFLPYVDGMVDEQETATRWFRRYTLREAIEDEAVIKTEFHLSDGRASWIYAGESFEAASLAEDGRALFTALQTGFADQLLDETARHWQGWRLQHPRSKLLVVCASEPQAKRVQRYLQKVHSLRVEVATYREEDADERIERFKGKQVDVLITVNKAYEGLDVPSITHIACLTHIRSVPWLNQMLARAWRYDPKGAPYREQVAFVFAPADQSFQQAISLIWEAFRNRVMDTPDRSGAGADGDDQDEPGTVREVVTPRESELTDTIGRGFEQEWPDVLDLQERLMARGMAPLPLDVLAAVMAELQSGVAAGVGGRPRMDGAAYRTPGERIDGLRRDLNNNVQRAASELARTSGLEHGECARDVNAQVVRRWRRRDLMDEGELTEAITWVRQYYGLD